MSNLIMTRPAFDALGPQERMDFIRRGGEVRNLTAEEEQAATDAQRRGALDANPNAISRQHFDAMTPAERARFIRGNGTLID